MLNMCAAALIGQSSSFGTGGLKTHLIVYSYDLNPASTKRTNRVAKKLGFSKKTFTGLTLR